MDLDRPEHQRLDSTNSYNEVDNETTYLLIDQKHSQKKSTYPKRVFFIICNEFCERFNFHGLQTILNVYLIDKLHLDESSAAIQLTVFNVGVYFTCLIGGILSDSWLGKYKTILSLSIVYVIGSGLVSIGTLPHVHEAGKILFYIGLMLIALGSGGIKPCVAAFAGEQFKLPEQSEYLENFFSIFFFAINAGSLSSTFLTPILKGKVHCFGDNDCYSLAFAVPAILMIFAIVIFAIGRSSYTMVEPSGNMLFNVAKCIWHGIVTKRRESRYGEREHFLDYSIGKYGFQLVNDTKCLLNVSVLLLPLPMFWTLYTQRSSLWVNQAKRMDLFIGTYKMQPEHMQTITPILMLALIPMFDYVIYPLLSKIGVRRPLQKISIGGLLAAFAFLLDAIVQYVIETHPLHTMSFLWQLPQIIIITLADIMFSINCFAFSFEQAPKSMKSVILSGNLLTIAAGNAIFAFLSDFQIFKYRSHDYVFYEFLMLIDMLFFMYLADRYKPNRV